MPLIELDENETVSDVMSPREARQLAASRDIVNEIRQFGVNDFMIQHIIYLLSLEMEDRQALEKISGVVKECLEKTEERKELIT